MKNVLVYSLYAQGYQEVCQLQAAKDHIDAGDNVLFLTCSKTCGCCSDNMFVDHTQCNICNHYQKVRAKRILGKNATIKSLDDYITKEIIEKSESYELKYNTVLELRNLTYDGVEIGYGAMSSYISWTRNMSPELNSDFREYINYLLRMQIRLVLICHELSKSFKPDLIVFHNGRYAHYKPIYGYALVNKIDFICTETVTSYNGKIQRDNFINSIPHDATMCNKKHVDFWNNYKDLNERDIVARMFFENKRHSKFAGDRIYTLGQNEEELPKGIDPNKENIVIFNSSEDEFAAVGSIVEKGILFNDQYLAIKKIVEHYLDDKTKHFYLRVHPNLNSVHYRYHQILYSLDYKNLTIIPSSSKVSSYKLMDIADKVLVFGSSMGIESSYWGKPVLLLRFSIYRDLDVVYIPKTENEMWDLLDNPHLPPKKQENAMKFGLYYMSDKHQPFTILDLKVVKHSLFGIPFSTSNFYKLFGSVKIHAFCQKAFEKLLYPHSPFRRFKRIPD